MFNSFDADSHCNLCKMSEGLFAGILAFAGAALWVFMRYKKDNITLSVDQQILSNYYYYLFPQVSFLTFLPF